MCLRYRVCDKYSVFISMSGGVSGGQGDRFLLVGRLRMRGNNVPWGPPALDSQNRKQHPAHKPPSALSQYLFALITQNVIVHHAVYVCLPDRSPCEKWESLARGIAAGRAGVVESNVCLHLPVRFAFIPPRGYVGEGVIQ